MTEDMLNSWYKANVNLTKALIETIQLSSRLKTKNIIMGYSTARLLS